ncbi:MAG: 2',5' RNA ligase family [Syntrophus sp. PtaB.Bin001]|nr:MAG: 2',5' RNA ligase family [Syntrophus sp. PtaB.Bin001]
MSDVGNIRAFLAIDPSETVRQSMATLQNRLKYILTGAISWVRPEGIHLTLKFFGNIAEADIARISNTVGPIAARFSPLDLEVRRLGLFPDYQRPRVVWLGLEGDIISLKALQKEVDQELALCGFSREDRSFRAHLTLARIKSVKGLSGLDRAMNKSETFDAGLFRADALTLFRSNLTPQGAIYSKLASYPFKIAG